MQSPVEEPLPRVVVLTGKAIREYFEEALAEEGASLATWVVLYGVERGGWDNQRDLAKDRADARPGRPTADPGGSHTERR